MTAILGWFVYFKIAFIFEALISLKESSLFEYLVMLRFCTILIRNHFESLSAYSNLWVHIRISAVPRSLLISSLFSVKWVLFLPLIYRAISKFWKSHMKLSYLYESFTVFQKSLLSMTDFSFKFSYLLTFLKRKTQKLLCFDKAFYFPHSCFIENYCVI